MDEIPQNEFELYLENAQEMLEVAELMLNNDFIHPLLTGLIMQSFMRQMHSLIR